jgi:hypothetical protein
MGLLEDVKNLVEQYTSGGSPQDVATNFSRVVDASDPDALSPGIAAAFRSDETPPFANMVTDLFSNASPDQKAGMLNALLGSVPPELQATLRPMIPGAAAAAPISRTHAENVSPDAVTQIAEKVERHNPGAIDLMSDFYARHPALVKTLGSAAMMIAMRKMADRRA